MTSPRFDLQFEKRFRKNDDKIDVAQIAGCAIL